MSMVVYNGNGYTDGTVPVDNIDYVNGTAVVIKVPGTMSRSGYEFTRYTTAADGTGSVYQGLDLLDITDNVTLYAQWVKGVALPRDTNGWTVLTPSPTSRLIYVSTSGNNSTAQYYSPSDSVIGSDPFNPTGSILAYATFAAADAVARTGYDDYILFKYGDKFTATSIAPKSGSDDTHLFVYGGYGNNANSARPIIEPAGTDTAAITLIGSVSLHDTAIVNIDFYGELRDPTSSIYNATLGDPLGFFIETDTGTVRQVLFENVCFRFFSSNIIQLYGALTGTISEIVFRRSSILNNYYDDAHSQGIYASHLTGIIIDECIFDHNGWYAQAPSTPGTATIFNHNTYFTDCKNVLFRHNTFMRPSSIHNKFTANDGVVDEAGPITLFENLYIDGELGIEMGGNMDFPYRFFSPSISRNVFTEIGRSQPTNRTLAWTFYLYDWDGGAVTQNVNVFNSNVAVTNVVGMLFNGGCRNTRIDSNVFYDLNKTGSYTNTVLTVDHVATKSGLIWERNTIQQPTYGENFISFADSVDLPGFVFSNNKYYSTTTAPFIVAGATYTQDQWHSLTGDSIDSVHVTFPDATNAIETYQSHVGSTPTISAFMAICDSLNKGNWLTNYMTIMVNDWIRAGFVVTDTPPSPSSGLVMVLK
jgi:hypothetical protein